MQRKINIVSAIKDRSDSLEATAKTLLDREIMEQIEAGDRNIKKDRVRSAREFLKEL